MTPDTPLHRALDAWRRSEQRLLAADADAPDRADLEADVASLRARYQALFEELQGTAGDGAPFADDEPVGNRPR